MKNSEIFRKVRRIIADNECHYLCGALSKLQRIGDISLVEQRDATHWIEMLLYPYCRYEVWLEYEFSLSGNCQEMRRARLAWLDWMIDYWQRKEAQ